MVAARRFTFFSMVSVLLLLAVMLPHADAGEGFHPLRAFFRKAVRQRLENASVRLVIVSNDRLYNCSGVFISPQGHILTSLHCLGSILQRRGEAHLSSILSGGLFLSVPRQFTKDVLFGVTAYTSNNTDLGHPELIDVGPGAVMRYPELTTIFGFVETFLLTHGGSPSDFQARAADFAILKLNSRPQSIANSCLPLATASASSAQQRIFGIGYPLPAARRNGGSTRGLVLVASEGRVLRGFEDTPWAVTNGYNPSQMQTLNSMTLSPGMSLADIDAVPGSSGSPVVNERGEILSMVTLSSSTASHYEAGLTYAYGASALREVLAHNLGEAAAAEIFSCPRGN